jgi:predicted amidophosphoribosyltransferase
MADSVLKAVLLALELTWHGQWQLDAWPNVLITIVLLGLTLWLAWRRGFSPLEMISSKLDRGLVTALRRRFPVRKQSFPLSR